MSDDPSFGLKKTNKKVILAVGETLIFVLPTT